MSGFADTAWIDCLSSSAAAATPGPWFVGYADDSEHMSAAYVGIVVEPTAGWPKERDVVAVTALQSPELAVSDLADENNAFIVTARTTVPQLCHALGEALRQREQLIEAVSAFVRTAPRAPRKRSLAHVLESLERRSPQGDSNSDMVGRLRSSANAATPGPWYAGEVAEPSPTYAGTYVATHRPATRDWPLGRDTVAVTRLRAWSRSFFVANDRHQENAAFIAAARTGAARLCDTTERAMSERAALVSVLRELTSGPPTADALVRAHRLLADGNGN